VKTGKPNLEESIQVESRSEWRGWLHKHHALAKGIWLVRWKKDSNKPHLSYDDAVEEGLCYGWIDSRPRSLDSSRSMLWFAQRKAGSGWSALNKARVERLMAIGLMAAAGLAKIADAKADGSWTALDAVDALEVPADLKEALIAHAPATEYFDNFPRSAKRTILEWIAGAKTAATRLKRIERTAVMAAANERANQWRR
jgi:uncharacterized protein YdeI (YjbR/CyaY-like superfamily)